MLNRKSSNQLIALIFLLAVLVSACSSSAKKVVPLPPEPVSSEEIDASVKNPIAVYETDQTQEESHPSESLDPLLQQQPPRRTNSQTVIALMDQARDQELAGRSERAAAVLERALRIEPRNPELWHRLAKLRYKQGQYTLAESLAAKSSALARDDWQLKEENNLLIQQVRKKRLLGH